MDFFDQFYTWANTLALIPWLLMMLAPNWKLTERFADSLVVPALFSLAYLATFFLIFQADSFSDFSTLEGVTSLFAKKEAVLVGWLHYIAFDLFVGTWEYKDAKEKGIPHLLLVPCLIFTLMAGPIGLLMYLGIRRVYWGRT